MGVSVNAILIGNIPPGEVAERVEALGFGAVELRAQSVSRGCVLIFDDIRPPRRQLWVWPDGVISDHLEVYDGERTYLSLGSSGSAQRIMTGLAEIYGGFVMDEAEGGDWTYVPADPDSTAAAREMPESRLARELGVLVGSEIARGMRALAKEDPEKFSEFLSICERYRERAAEPDRAPTPRM